MPQNGESETASRVAVVTGATSGIGREIALGIASRGFTTVVVGRGQARADQTAREVSSATGNPRVQGVGVSDLALQSDVRRLAEELRAKFPQVHVLVNNAGAYFNRREVTPEGFERTFALNVLAPFSLTVLLLDRLAAGAPSRVVNMSSAAHERAMVPWDDLQLSQGFGGFQAYGDSKLELLLLSREFARRLAPLNISVNAVHPGFVASHFGQNNGGGTKAVIRVLEFLFARRPPKGAETPIHVATSPEVAGHTGEYFADLQVRPGSLASRDMRSAKRLFEECTKLSGLPEVQEPAPVAGPATVAPLSRPAPA